MTNIKHVLEKAKKISPFAYLTDGIDIPTVEILENVVEELNKRGIQPERSKKYSYSIANNIFYGKYEDKNFEIELIRYCAKKRGKLNEINSLLDSARLLIQN